MDHILRLAEMDVDHFSFRRVEIYLLRLYYIELCVADIKLVNSKIGFMCRHHIFPKVDINPVNSQPSVSSLILFGQMTPVSTDVGGNLGEIVQTCADWLIGEHRPLV